MDRLVPSERSSWGAHALGLLGATGVMVAHDACVLAAVFGFLAGIYAATWSHSKETD